jgi:hypothetical protein
MFELFVYFPVVTYFVYALVFLVVAVGFCFLSKSARNLFGMYLDYKHAKYHGRI